MSVKGHSQPSLPGSKHRDVRYTPNSDQNFQRRDWSRWASFGHAGYSLAVALHELSQLSVRTGPFEADQSLAKVA